MRKRQETFVEKTKEIWGNIYGRAISDEEVKDIIAGMKAYLKVLSYLEEKQKEKVCQNHSSQ